MSEEKKSVIQHPATKAELDKLINGDKPVLVDFYAEWCGPCQMVGPMLEEMTESYKNIDKVVIAKLDTEAVRDVAMEYGVMSIPTFIFFSKGKPAETFVGLRPMEELEEKLDELIK